VTMDASVLFALSEDIRSQDYLLATYYLEMDAESDVLGKAAAFAVGQTIGTWIEVPGVTDAMRHHHQGKVVKVLEAPPVDLSSQAEGATHGFFIQLALPVVNFGAQFPMMLTTLLGNDASTSVQAKLVDIELPDGFAAGFGGPRHGIAGVRELVGVPDRPLLLNMIKPCTGLTPEAGARIFYETALGGIDLIKDDELLGDPEFAPITERVRAYGAAARAAFEETGKDVVYIVNVTDSPDKVVDNARRAVDAGARALMVTYATVGYGVLQALAAAVDVPIMGHFAGSGVFFEGPRSGMSAPLAAGMLPRLAGADLVLATTPYGGYPMRRLQYLRTVHQLVLPRPHIAPAMPVVGGGVHPGVVPRYVRELGHDLVLGAGGSIQGHPGGAAAGVRAMRQAIDAAAAGRDLDEAAREHPELATALGRWGRQD
jgi:2,3-diketo-5-methylthiopentyl-1-phosphate enolase